MGLAALTWRRVWILAFALRIAIALIPGGNPYDQTCFKAWGLTMAHWGPATFYLHSLASVPCDYPPVIPYLLGAWGWLAHLAQPGLFDWNREAIGAMSWLNAWYKLPACFADLANGFVIYRLLTPRVGEDLARRGATLYLLNPIFIYDAAYWGQIDAVLILGILATAWALLERRLVLALLLGALCLLMKPQAVFVVPVLLAAAWHRRFGLSWLVGTLAAAGVTLAVIWPCWPGGDPRGAVVGLARLLGATAASYPFGSMNAFNVHALRGMALPDSATWLGLSERVWGLIALGAAQIAVAIALYRRRDDGAFFLGLAVGSGAFYMLATRMHERYLVPSLACLAVATAFSPGLLRAYRSLSAIAVVNLLYAQSPEVAHFLNIDGSYRFLVGLNLVVFAHLFLTLMRPERLQPVAV